MCNTSTSRCDMVPGKCVNALLVLLVTVLFTTITYMTLLYSYSLNMLSGTANIVSLPLIFHIISM